VGVEFDLGCGLKVRGSHDELTTAFERGAVLNKRAEKFVEHACFNQMDRIGILMSGLEQLIDS